MFRLVREANPKARTIVITGHRSEMDRLVQQVVKEGADAVCYKPFDMPKLLETLNRLVQQLATEAADAQASRISDPISTRVID